MMYLTVLALLWLATASANVSFAGGPMPSRSNQHALKRSGTDRMISSIYGDYFPDDEDEVVTITGKFWYVSDLTDKDSVQDIVDGYIATMNEVLDNSGVKIVYEQWGSIQDIGQTTDDLTYNDGDPNRNFGDAFVYSGLFDTVETARAYIKQTADQMILLTNQITGGYAGVCLGFGPWESGWDGIYMTVVMVGDPDYGITFAHEAGHCLGGMHNEDAPWGTGSTDNANFGHCLGDYATVMSYESSCPDGAATTIPYYSNPDVEYCDDAGVCAATGTDEHNNAGYINEKRFESQDDGTNCNDGFPDDNYEMPYSCDWQEWSEWTEWSDCCCDDYETWEAGEAAEQCTELAAVYEDFDILSYRGDHYFQRMITRQCQNGIGEEVYASHCELQNEFHPGYDTYDYEVDTCNCPGDLPEEGEIWGDSAQCVELITPNEVWSYEGIYYLEDYTINGHYVWATATGDKLIYWYVKCMDSGYCFGDWYVASSSWVNPDDTPSQTTSGYGVGESDNPWDGDWDFYWTELYVEKLDDSACSTA